MEKEGDGEAVDHREYLRGREGAPKSQKIETPKYRQKIMELCIWRCERK